MPQRGNLWAGGVEPRRCAPRLGPCSIENNGIPNIKLQAACLGLVILSNPTHCIKSPNSVLFSEIARGWGRLQQKKLSKTTALL